ncbi:hypothetical protein D3C81_1627420 [compost metagenome]
MLNSIPAIPNNVRNICEKNRNTTTNRAWNIQKAKNPWSICPPNINTNEVPMSEIRREETRLMKERAPNLFHRDTSLFIVIEAWYKFIPISIVPTKEANTNIIGTI